MKTPYGWSVCLPWQGDLTKLWQSKQALELLEPDRWMDYWCAQPVDFPGYVPTVRARHLESDPVPLAVIQRLAAHPEGETWLLFNEAHLSEQDDCSPDKAADLTLKFTNLVNGLGSYANTCGPNAAINMAAQHNGGVSGAAWHREYLRLCRARIIKEPSIIGLHTYHGTDLSMLRATWAMLRDEWRWQWMGSAPVIVTEACAENEPLHRQIEVMDELWRLYQIGRADGPAGQRGTMGVFWFVAYANQWPNCHLVEVDPGKNETMRLTPLGKHWLELKARS